MQKLQKLILSMNYLSDVTFDRDRSRDLQIYRSTFPDLSTDPGLMSRQITCTYSERIAASTTTFIQ
jgi:hypothetical protein